jgi:hypothetical protein
MLQIDELLHWTAVDSCTWIRVIYNRTCCSLFREILQTVYATKREDVLLALSLSPNSCTKGGRFVLTSFAVLQLCCSQRWAVWILKSEVCVYNVSLLYRAERDQRHYRRFNPEGGYSWRWDSLLLLPPARRLHISPTVWTKFLSISCPISKPAVNLCYKNHSVNAV